MSKKNTDSRRNLLRLRPDQIGKDPSRRFVLIEHFLVDGDVYGAESAPASAFGWLMSQMKMTRHAVAPGDEIVEITGGDRGRVTLALLKSEALAWATTRRDEEKRAAHAGHWVHQ